MIATDAISSSIFLAYAFWFHFYVWYKKNRYFLFVEKTNPLYLSGKNIILLGWDGLESKLIQS